MSNELKNRYLKELFELLRGMYDIPNIPKEILDYFDITDFGYILGNEEWSISEPKISDLLNRMNINLELYDKLSDVFFNMNQTINDKINLYMRDLYNYEVYVDKSSNISYNPFIHLNSYELKHEGNFFIDNDNIKVDVKGKKFYIENVGNSPTFRIKFTDSFLITRFFVPMLNLDIIDIDLGGPNWIMWGNYYIFDDNVRASDITITCKFVKGNKGVIFTPEMVQDEYVDIGILAGKFGSQFNFFGGSVLDFYLVDNVLFYYGDTYNAMPFPIWMTLDESLVFPVFTTGSINIDGDFTITQRYGGGSIVKGTGNINSVSYNIDIPRDAKWGFVYSDGKNIRVVDSQPQNYISFAFPSLGSITESDISLNVLNIADVSTMLNNTLDLTMDKGDEYVAS